MQLICYSASASTDITLIVNDYSEQDSKMWVMNCGVCSVRILLHI